MAAEAAAAGRRQRSTPCQPHPPRGKGGRRRCSSPSGIAARTGGSLTRGRQLRQPRRQQQRRQQQQQQQQRAAPGCGRMSSREGEPEGEARQRRRGDEGSATAAADAAAAEGAKHPTRSAIAPARAMYSHTHPNRTRTGRSAAVTRVAQPAVPAELRRPAPQRDVRNHYSRRSAPTGAATVPPTHSPTRPRKETPPARARSAPRTTGSTTLCGNVEAATK